MTHHTVTKRRHRKRRDEPQVITKQLVRNLAVQGIYEALEQIMKQLRKKKGSL